ncbi:DNA-directed RNA polymerase sigma-70 factor [Actinoplanes ianthinogenes]|uniref:DNA-directed RNA polymerase sigma-70 factor n=1 Tax=Actinoplanes ianthinogenes TaxID=122358 RepID=A0ABM7M5W5_9ACTN|nr:RNA polymerase sigma factor [Actinoplanes ianthinogenes]BCJ47031.1 DNA-directed RNA polymerase sigma-70 factor [Actinoplanes ianthinogenes]GGR13790.1 DNA-directed RNA polymerase sigma-70 factor [Actinoplanes ianthinogenes]
MVVIKSRDVPADRFTDLFDRYHGEIYRYVAGRLSASHADDLAAETFLVAFRKQGTLHQADQARAWLYGIATNLIRRHHRDEERRYRALSRVGSHAEPADNDHDRILSRVAAGVVQRELAVALRALRPADRDVLLLVALADLGYAEVGIALGIPEGTVASRLNRARKAVRAALGGADPTRDSSGAIR